VAQFGTLTLTQKTGGVLLPVAASTSDAWICKRCWDRNVMPRPNAEIRILIGEPIEVPPGLDAAALEAKRALLEQRLLAMHSELDARTGFSDSQPLRAPVTEAAPA
jgi:hypothetical protein